MTAAQKAQRASIPIISLTENNLPADSASACLVKFPTKTILLTVAHATREGEKWAVVCRYVPKKKAVEHFTLGSIGYLGTLSVGKLKRGSMTPNPIDFAYAVVPDNLCILEQNIDTDGVIITEREKLILPPEYADPKKGDTFCFYGLAKGELTSDARFIRQERLLTGMTYWRSDGFFHRFRCQGGFRVAEHVGCSGAPILNSSGQLVSLVVQGRDDKQEVTGINLGLVWAALLIEAGIGS